MPRCERGRRAMRCWGCPSLATCAKRGRCDTLAAHHNNARPLADSLLAHPAIPCMHRCRLASQQCPRLTARLLDPLGAPHCFLSPPPRYCTQLQTPRHIASWLPFSSSFSPSPSPSETLKGAKKFFLDSFRIVFERFEGFSRKSDPTPANWILKHECVDHWRNITTIAIPNFSRFRSPSVSSRLRIGTRKLRNLPASR